MNTTLKKMKKLRTPLGLGTLLLALLMLSGCASNNLTSPCKDFGAQCKKIPVNHWNTNT